MNKRYWYEIHLTVDLGSIATALFVEACHAIGVKPLCIDLERSGATMQRDVMTSSKMVGTDEDAIREAKRIQSELQQLGFSTVRVKIECEPTHPEAPQTVGDVMPEHSYFESHIAFLCTPAQEIALQQVAHESGARVSRNPFKKTDKGKVIMMTLRDYENPFEVFKKKLESAIRSAKAKGLHPYKKIEVEYAVYDSNWQHDHAWIVG